MSFLNELCSKKNQLKPTMTIVTHLDGSKFKEVDLNTKLNIESVQFGFVVDTKPDNIPVNIIDNVFLGSQDCCDINVLNGFNIDYVLSVGIEAPTKYTKIVYKFVQCLDIPETNLLDKETLNESLNFIENAKQEGCNVLVHCNAGVSRSPSIVIAYLILVHHYTFKDAFNFVKLKRSCIRPNDGFLNQLKTLNN